MKKQTTIIFTIGIFLASFTAGFAQDKIEKTITFKFKNNSILPHKYTFITYAPNQKGNGTFGDVFVPFGTKEFNVKIGTKIYLAKRKQVRTVMGGGVLTGEPFYDAKPEDDGKIIKLRR